MVVIPSTARMCMPCRCSSTRNSGFYGKSQSNVKRQKAVRYRNKSTIPYKYRYVY